MVQAHYQIVLLAQLDISALKSQMAALVTQ
jgi:hypothetical protein